MIDKEARERIDDLRDNKTDKWKFNGKVKDLEIKVREAQDKVSELKRQLFCEHEWSGELSEKHFGKECVRCGLFKPASIKLPMEKLEEHIDALKEMIDKYTIKLSCEDCNNTLKAAMEIRQEVEERIDRHDKELDAVLGRVIEINRAITENTNRIENLEEEKKQQPDGRMSEDIRKEIEAEVTAAFEKKQPTDDDELKVGDEVMLDKDFYALCDHCDYYNFNPDKHGAYIGLGYCKLKRCGKDPLEKCSAFKAKFLIECFNEDKEKAIRELFDKYTDDLISEIIFDTRYESNPEKVTEEYKQKLNEIMEN